jgi:hypothetical protein
MNYSIHIDSLNRKESNKNIFFLLYRYFLFFSKMFCILKSMIVAWDAGPHKNLQRVHTDYTAPHITSRNGTNLKLTNTALLT